MQDKNVSYIEGIPSGERSTFMSKIPYSVYSLSALGLRKENPVSRNDLNEDATNAKENLMHENEIAKLILDSATRRGAQRKKIVANFAVLSVLGVEKETNFTQRPLR